MARVHLFLQLVLCLFVLTLFPGQVEAQNRTFTLTTINPEYPEVDNKPVVRTNNIDPSTVGVGFVDPSSLTAFIYNQKLYRYCSSSPTGVCIGYFQKNYGGALTGLNLNFWSSENFPTTNPCCSVSGTWAVENIGGVDYLTNGVDETGSGGSTTYQLCEYYGGGYSVSTFPHSKVIVKGCLSYVGFPCPIKTPVHLRNEVQSFL